MDIVLIKQLFFQRSDYKKTDGFNSYSKDHDDILKHYKLKYPELSASVKAIHPYSQKLWDDLIHKIPSSDIVRLCQTFPPFELFIASFLFAFSKEYNCAIKLFKSCQSKLHNSLSDKIIKIFIDLQIAQLYERLGIHRKALLLLKKVYKKIHSDNTLYRHTNNFFASCCVSIGLLCCRYMNNSKLAASFFLTSTITRSNNFTFYSAETYKHYISQAFRYIGMMPYFSPQDSYIFLKSSYQMTLELYRFSADKVIQSELFHLMKDFILFLICNQFKIDLINSISKKMLLLISNLSTDLKKELTIYIITISQTLFRYYKILNIPRKAILWRCIMRYFEHYALNNDLIKQIRSNKITT